MKKNHITPYTLALLMLGFASCSQEEDFAPQNGLKDTPITVTADVAALNTRAGHDNNNLPETFYLSIDQTGDGYDYSAQMKYEDGSWVAYHLINNQKITLLWAGGTETLTVTAATYLLDEASLAVETDQSTEDNLKASDHLSYYNAAVTPSANGISVDFLHIMSKVNLTITLGTEFDSGENPITGVTFGGTKASNAADAAVTGITPLTGAYTGPTTEAPNATAKYEVILMPQTVAAEGFTVQFTVSGRSFQWTSSDEVTFEKGTEYKINLKVGQDKVTLGDILASSWNFVDGVPLETE